MTDAPVDPAGFRLHAFELDWIQPLKAQGADPHSEGSAAGSQATLAHALLLEARAWVVAGSRVGYFPQASEVRLDMGGMDVDRLAPSLLEDVDLPGYELDIGEFALAFSCAMDDLTDDRREFLRLCCFGAQTEWSARVTGALEVAETLAHDPGLTLSAEAADSVAWCLEGAESDIRRSGLPSDWRSHELVPVANRAQDLAEVRAAFADVAREIEESMRAQVRPELGDTGQPASSLPGAPAFPVVGPTTTSWREHALTRARELQLVAEWVQLVRDPVGGDPRIQMAVRSIRDHIEAASDAASGFPGTKRSWLSRARAALGGGSAERAFSNLDAAAAEILSIASRDYVRGQLSTLLAHVRRYLPANDARRMQIEDIAVRGGVLTDAERDAVVGAVRIASIESRRGITRVRSFRKVLYGATAVLALAVAGVVTLGATNPGVVSLCFNPGENQIVCPTSVEPVRDTQSPVAIDAAVRRAAGSWDIPVVALLGLAAAAIAAAASLRKLKGTSTPYSLPIALATLKLPAGALTAVLGLLLIRGEFVPGLGAFDSPAQILAWAVVLGYAQQLFTGQVDRRAQDVLDDIAKSDTAAALESPARATAAPAVTPDIAPLDVTTAR